MTQYEKIWTTHPHIDRPERERVVSAKAGGRKREEGGGKGRKCRKDEPAPIPVKVADPLMPTLLRMTE
jgi:hypothetical protein